MFKQSNNGKLIEERTIESVENESGNGRRTNVRCFRMETNSLDMNICWTIMLEYKHIYNAPRQCASANIAGHQNKQSCMRHLLYKLVVQCVIASFYYQYVLFHSQTIQICPFSLDGNQILYTFLHPYTMKIYNVYHSKAIIPTAFVLSNNEENETKKKLHKRTKRS